MLALIAAVFMGCNGVANRALKHVPTSVICFYNFGGGAFFTAVYIGLESLVTAGSDARMGLADYTSRQYLIATGAGLFDFGAMTSSTLAFQSDSSSFVSLFSYLNIIYGYLCDVLILGESLNTVESGATLLILVVAVSVAYHKLKQKKK